MGKYWDFGKDRKGSPGSVEEQLRKKQIEAKWAWAMVGVVLLLVYFMVFYKY